jgi:hypothetical protein
MAQLVTFSEYGAVMSQELLDINGLSKELGPDAFPVRRIRTLKAQRKIPFIKLGHRTLVFNVQKVRAALERLETKAVS